MINQEIGQILTSVTNQTAMEQYYNEKLGALEKYDVEHGTDYMEFLQMYLELDGSVQQLASTRYVHRNTVNYQLNKVKKILGHDIATLERRFELLLAYQIFAVLHNNVMVKTA